MKKKRRRSRETRLLEIKVSPRKYGVRRLSLLFSLGSVAASASASFIHIHARSKAVPELMKNRFAYH